ncbi:uncharacterized protein LOC130640911 [Hydractinia symbiolongicarpus]|uniref:uncharacterized protein LOC130640911 n=1 Tax=Hydractinia symbiolongicarpus TaxID=13093 RepID=UPI00254F08AD|nr:uncharacterized protein LOC130640911 [Hydractinia symbiolongicarpus]XP_057303498.1 uncharacterized protein LOC130640911 [Hydractinia symbiolongicarpus]XP_057303499.1 uncharacterized protein LOC130640911 [Hydractinia symbiolongicarpus]XP_057303500.1 uncharacterized protein LOC130640911 [Hydractinia symbiolongicarpus]XP_057303501.1 uncharacterized protein LOC130640911 [Hydractinia symbiolongicarpus]
MKSTIVLVWCCFIQSLIAVNIWDIIEKANNESTKAKNHNKRLFGGPSNDESSIVEGDILKDTIPAPAPRWGAVFNWHRKLWMGRIVPYEITGNLRNSGSRNVIEQALKTISSVSCLSFREKISSDVYWIKYYVGSGCYSGVGRRYFEKNQPRSISLAPLCVRHSIVLHETLHALGFYHEQKREDRDSFVKIYKDRILSRKLPNFSKNLIYEFDAYGTPYDYHSIMHYVKDAFIKPGVTGNTIEAKFDPNIRLGSNFMSTIDVTELNRLYQCDIKKGWGKWTEWSPCIVNDKKRCLKAKVRICVSTDVKECPGVDQYGVQEQVQECTASECEADKHRKDGNWGRWGEYSKCSGSCGWGRQERYRKCDNPVPSATGKKCVGADKNMKLCRNKRCGRAFPGDNDFDSSNWGQWTSKGFALKQTSGWRDGPFKDHTSEIRGSSYKSFYASASGKSVWVLGSGTIKQLWSPLISSFSGPKCISFHYMLNGAHLHPTQALSVFIKDNKNNRINLPFKIGGHHGNYWRRHSINVKGLVAPFQFVFEVKFQEKFTSEVAIDDIFFDHNACQVGLTGCTDVRKDCQQMASKCNSKTQFRTMLGGCCATCNKPEYVNAKETCTDSKDGCYYWSKSDLCTTDTYKDFMKTYCCSSCNNKPTCKDDKHEKCKSWASVGECKKNKKWMLINCCSSCFKIDP